MIHYPRSDLLEMWASDFEPPRVSRRLQLLKWVKRHEIDSGARAGVTTEERERIKALACEVKKLRRANEILKSASAFFAQVALEGELKK